MHWSGSSSSNPKAHDRTKKPNSVSNVRSKQPESIHGPTYQPKSKDDQLRKTEKSNVDKNDNMKCKKCNSFFAEVNQLKSHETNVHKMKHTNTCNKCKNYF